MAFNIADLFGIPAISRMLTPQPNAQGIQGFAQQPQQVAPPPQQQQADPWAGLREDSIPGSLMPRQPDPMTTGATAQAPKKNGFLDKYQSFTDSDRGQYLRDMFSGWAMGKDPMQSIGLGAQMASSNRGERKQVNQTVEWLKKQGYGAEEATFIAGNKSALQNVLNMQAEANDPAKKLDMQYKQAQIDAIGRKGEGGTEYGLNPQYGTDAQGNPVLIQIGKDGKSIQTALPDGVSLSKEPIKMDAGTHFVLLDPITRQQVGIIPKDNRQAEADKAKGKIEGENEANAQAGLSRAISDADTSIGLIEAMLTHPGREVATGLSSTIDPRNYFAGTDATDFNVRRKQLDSRAFLQAFESLKGGGAITDVEGGKATEAIARLNTAQSDDAYIQALQELKGLLQQGKSQAQQRAQGRMQPAQQQAPPMAAPMAAPNVDDLLKKYGQ